MFRKLTRTKTPPTAVFLLFLSRLCNSLRFGSAVPYLFYWQRGLFLVWCDKILACCSTKHIVHSHRCLVLPPALQWVQNMSASNTGSHSVPVDRTSAPVIRGIHNSSESAAFWLTETVPVSPSLSCPLFLLSFPYLACPLKEKLKDAD